MKITKSRLKKIIREEITKEGLFDFFKKEEPYKAPDKLARMRQAGNVARAQRPVSQPPDPSPDLYNMVDEIYGGLGKVFKAYKEWPAHKAREAASQFRTQVIGTGVRARKEKWERLVRDVGGASSQPRTGDPGRDSYTKFVTFLKNTK